METLLFLLFAFAVAVGLVFLTRNASTRLATLVHGICHSSYVYQILNGLIPPTSPHTLGMPASSYWVWHLLLAIGTKLLGITPPEVVTYINTLSLLLALSAAWVILKEQIRTFWNRVILSLISLVFFSPLLGVQYIYRAGRIRFLLLESYFQHYHQDAALLPKFVKYTAFPTGAAAFFVLFAVMSSRSSRVIPRGIASFILSYFVAIIHPTTGLAVLVLAIADFCVSALDFTIPLRKRLLLSLWVPSCCAVGLLLSVPIVLPITQQFAEPVRVVADMSGFWSGVATVAPFLPICALGFLCFRSFSPSVRFALLSFFGLLLCSCILTLVHRNQYKLVMLAGLPATIVLTGLLVRISHSLAEHCQILEILLGRLVQFAACLVLLAYPVVVHSTLAKAKAKQIVLFNGRNIDLAVHGHPKVVHDKQKAYEWLRRHTPVAAFVMEEPEKYNRLFLSAIAQRRVVAARPSLFTKKLEFQESLVKTVTRILKQAAQGRSAANDYHELLSFPLDWPESLYIFVERDTRTSTGVDYSRVFENWPVDASLVYQNEHFLIYRIDRESASTLTL